MSITKEGIRNGRVGLGGWMMTGSPEVAGIMAGEGFDFIGVDMEHTPTAGTRCYAAIFLC